MTTATKTKDEAQLNGAAPKRKGRPKKADKVKAQQQQVTQEIKQDVVKWHGEALMWNLPYNHTRKNQYQQIKDALVATGLDDKVLKERSIRSACTRAVNELEGRGEKRERIIDVTRKDSDGIWFQFSARSEKSTGDEAGKEVLWSKETNVRLDLTSGKVFCKDHEVQERAQALIDKHLAQWTTSDVSNIVDKLFRANAELISLANAAYFVPHKHRGFTDRVEAFMKLLDRQVMRLPIPKGEGNCDDIVQGATVAYLDDLMEQLGKAVDGWDVKTRDDTMEEKAGDIGILSQKIEGLAEYLVDKAAEKKAQLAELQQKLLQKIDGVKEEKKALPPSEAGIPGRVFAALNSEAKTAKEIATEIGLDWTPYNLLNRLVAEGKAVKEGKGFKLPAA